MLLWVLRIHSTLPLYAAWLMAGGSTTHVTDVLVMHRTPTHSRMFIAGGCAGAIARTATAPLDRIKLLFQVQAVALPGTHTSQPAYTGVLQAARKILHEEGALAFWKGNGTNILRIFPYSAAQMSSNDQYKRLASDAVGCVVQHTTHLQTDPHPQDGRLSLPARLACGGCAGMTATALTHPLDTLRLRLALPNSGYQGTHTRSMSTYHTHPRA